MKSKCSINSIQCHGWNIKEPGETETKFGLQSQGSGVFSRLLYAWVSCQRKYTHSNTVYVTTVPEPKHTSFAVSQENELFEKFDGIPFTIYGVYLK